MSTISDDMKLSAAIEHCLVNGIYEHESYYMCHALKHIGQNRHRFEVMEMVHSLCEDCVSLKGAMHLIGVLRNGMPFEEEHKMTTEAYVWWVFDLKRKGL